MSFSRTQEDTAAAAHDQLQRRYKERMKRTYFILQSFDAHLADEVFNQAPQQDIDIYSASAVKIQKTYRGHIARKLYNDLLYDVYIQEIDRNREEEIKRIDEGMIMMENLRLEEDIRKKQFLTRQRELERNWAATVIQRKYRKFKRRPVPLSALPTIQGLEALKNTRRAQFVPVIIPVLDEEAGVPEIQWAQYLPRASSSFIFPDDFSVELSEVPSVFLKQHHMSSGEHSANEVGDDLEFPCENDISIDFSMTQYKDKAATQKLNIQSTDGLPLVLRTYSGARGCTKEALIKRAADLSEALESNLYIESNKTLARELKLREGLRQNLGFSNRLIEYLVKHYNPN